MKKVFLDTNILIDYLARRGQFFEPAAQIVQLGQQHEFGLLVSAMSFATASFILEAHHKLSNETIVRKFGRKKTFVILRHRIGLTTCSK